LLSIGIRNTYKTYTYYSRRKPKEKIHIGKCKETVDKIAPKTNTHGERHLICMIFNSINQRTIEENHIKYKNIQKTELNSLKTEFLKWAVSNSTELDIVS